MMNVLQLALSDILSILALIFSCCESAFVYQQKLLSGILYCRLNKFGMCLHVNEAPLENLAVFENYVLITFIPKY